MKFYIPAPDEWDPRTRVDLTFGLGDAIRYHREMTVPGIGGLRFVRQASWALAGIDIAGKDLGAKHYRARDIANAIEALGCKAEYLHVGKQKYEYIGSRAFGRYPDAYLFEDLKKESFYVRNTYRQTIVTALSSLGFCDSSTRFNQMKLTDKGENLKNAFYNSDVSFKKSRNERYSKGSCGEFLYEWVKGNKSKILKNDDLFHALSISTPTDLEKSILWTRLHSWTPRIEYDPNRRIRLMDVMNLLDFSNLSEASLCEELEKKGGYDHSRQIYDAIRFKELRQNAVELLRKCALIVDNLGGAEVELQKCASYESVRNAFDSLRTSCKSYLEKIHRKEDVPSTAIEFANSIVAKSVTDGIAYIVSKEFGVLDIVNNRLRPLNLFRKFIDRFSSKGEEDDQEVDDDENADLLNGDQVGFELPRLNQWFQLWRDAHV